MTRSKLSTADREELIRLFKETTETITSLANQFEVSVSTARRVLKTQLTPEEYEVIVANRLEGRQQKKTTQDSVQTEPASAQSDSEPINEANLAPETQSQTPEVPKPKLRSRRRSSAPTKSIAPPPTAAANISAAHPDVPEATPKPIAAEPIATPSHGIEGGAPLEILPIETASLPNQCYLVVDRSSELITPPLKEFSELGSIPLAEESAKTLPIFANHKIASRFSRRSQRIIKIPDSALLKKTYPMLTAKGVERILFDGQVFSLIRSS